LKKESQLKAVGHIAELAIRRSYLLWLQLVRKLNSGSRIEADRAARALLPKLLAGRPTILFLRQDRLGDAIVTTPLLVALADSYPNAQIIMLLGANNEGIAPLLPIKCETVVYRKDPRHDRAMLKILNRRSIDILIDLTDNASVTSSMLIRSIKPKVAIGIEKENGVVYDILVPRLDRAHTHIARRIAELLKPLAIEPDSFKLQPRLKIDIQEKIVGRIGINVSAGSSGRYAPASVYATIAREVAGETGVTEVRILSQPQDADYAKKIVELSKSDRVMTQPRAMAFAEFGSYLSTCEMIITPDTSVVHLGAAAGVPMVVIYAPIPEGLHYWTPTGVPYEMMVQRPTLAELDAASVVSLFESLSNRLRVERLAHQTA
jgi:heptosyltransferase-3